MQNLSHALVSIDVFCEWTYSPPRYRAFVNNELFTERSFIWDKDIYLKETLPICGVPGRYEIRFENIDPKHSKFRFENIQIIKGSGSIDGQYIDLR